MLSDNPVTIAGDDGDDARIYLADKVCEALAKLSDSERRHP